MSTAVSTNGAAKAPATIRQHLEGDSFRDAVSRVLPAHLTPERMIRLAISALSRVPKLADCTPQSVLRCMMDLSQWGLEPDGRRAHLIPYGKECTVIIDYKGLVELVYRSGVVASIHADVVCENDVFSVDRGELKAHVINYRTDRGAVYAAYCLIRMKDGSEKCEVLTRSEVEAIRSRSKAGRSGPWVTDWNEMAKKTAFRRVSKWIPLSAEIRDAVHGDDDSAIETIARPTPVKRPGLDDLTAMLTESPQQEESPAEYQPTETESPAPMIKLGPKEILETVWRPALAECSTISQCDSLMERAKTEGANPDWPSDFAADAIGLFAVDVEERKASIRSSRGPGSNK